MTIPAISSVSSILPSSSLGAGGASEQSLNLAEHAAGLSEPASASAPAGGGSNELAAGNVEATSGLEPSSGVEAGAGASAGGFGGALTNAISSLEQTQRNASTASQALASGTLSDPESAVVTVDEAQLAMQLASQIRTKATEAAQQIFQTQV